MAFLTTTCNIHTLLNKVFYEDVHIHSQSISKEWDGLYCTKIPNTLGMLKSFRQGFVRTKKFCCQNLSLFLFIYIYDSSHLVVKFFTFFWHKTKYISEFFAVPFCTTIEFGFVFKSITVSNSAHKFVAHFADLQFPSPFVWKICTYWYVCCVICFAQALVLLRARKVFCDLFWRKKLVSWIASALYACEKPCGLNVPETMSSLCSYLSTLVPKTV